jgi:hypothetical protein
MPRIPPLLARLLDDGRWQHPGDAVLRRVAPFIVDPLDFLTSVEEIARESKSVAHPEYVCEIYRERQGSQQVEPVELPWRDLDRSILVAVNRSIGADVAIALDFRTNAEDPRVIGTYWSDVGWRSGWIEESGWMEITPTFSQFLGEIGIST